MRLNVPRVPWTFFSTTRRGISRARGGSVTERFQNRHPGSISKGTFNCSREFGRRAIVSGRSGAILNIGSPTYHGGGPGFAQRGGCQGRSP